MREREGRVTLLTARLTALHTVQLTDVPTALPVCLFLRSTCSHPYSSCILAYLCLSLHITRPLSIIKFEIMLVTLIDCSSTPFIYMVYTVRCPLTTTTTGVHHHTISILIILIIVIIGHILIIIIIICRGHPSSAGVRLDMQRKYTSAREGVPSLPR
jgi:hypothetical protein